MNTTSNTNTRQDTILMQVANIRAAQAKIEEMQRGQMVEVDNRLFQVIEVGGTKVLRAQGNEYHVGDWLQERIDGRTFQSVHINNHRATAIVSA